MLQRLIIPVVVKVYIGMGIVLYTAQKAKLAVRKLKADMKRPADLKAGY